MYDEEKGYHRIPPLLLSIVHNGVFFRALSPAPPRPRAASRQPEVE